MKINESTLAELALALSSERKRQKLSREDAAAVCGVSTSFIRDAESSPQNCSLGKLTKLINGLGLSIEVSAFVVPSAVNGALTGLTAAAVGLHQSDFGVPESQLFARSKAGKDETS